jgi:formylglycine-generating enzyme required for sulfatase activity
MTFEIATRIDSRFPVTQEEWLNEPLPQSVGNPPGYWCFVPAASYVVGGWHHKQPQATIPLAHYWIARSPVTVAQYALFVHQGYSSHTQHSWTEEGWLWRQHAKRTQPWKWDDGDFTSPDQPIIGISWYEASVFAHWIHEQIRDTIPKGYSVCLPTEAEWEVAAAYQANKQRTIYPWGADARESLSLERAIYRVSERSSPACVGIRPASSAGCGAHDMVGNIFEWQTSSYVAYPANSHVKRTTFAQHARDVPVRGGSWLNSAAHIQCATRDWHRPDYYDHATGMRLVIAPDA